MFVIKINEVSERIKRTERVRTSEVLTTMKLIQEENGIYIEFREITQVVLKTCIVSFIRVYSLTIKSQAVHTTIAVQSVIVLKPHNPLQNGGCGGFGQALILWPDFIFYT